MENHMIYTMYRQQKNPQQSNRTKQKFMSVQRSKLNAKTVVSYLIFKLPNPLFSSPPNRSASSISQTGQVCLFVRGSVSPQYYSVFISIFPKCFSCVGFRIVFNRVHYKFITHTNKCIGNG